MAQTSTVVLAVAVAVLFVAPAAFAQKQCQNSAQLTPCLQKFFANLGFASSPMGFPYNSTVFAETLHQYLYQHDIPGWNNMRSWMNTLISCVGGKDNFEACSDWHIIMQMYGLSQAEATQYDAQFRVLEYEMGPAFEVMTRNWFCIKAADQNEGQVIAACRKTFNDEQHQNPNMTCQHIGELLNCIERPFVTHCGRQVAAAVCNIEKIIYSIVSPDCNSHVALHCNGAFNPFVKMPRLPRRFDTKQ